MPRVLSLLLCVLDCYHQGTAFPYPQTAETNRFHRLVFTFLQISRTGTPEPCDRAYGPVGRQQQQETETGPRERLEHAGGPGRQEPCGDFNAARDAQSLCAASRRVRDVGRYHGPHQSVS